MLPKGIDEPDFGKEKLKSLGAITRELITGEALYLQSLQCIVEVNHTHSLLSFSHAHFLSGLHTSMGSTLSGCFPGWKKGNHFFKLGRHLPFPKVSDAIQLHSATPILFCRQFYEKLLTCTGVQEICQCFKAHVSHYSIRCIE